MAYHISRNGQTYGPYTLDDLERYIASGHVLLNDLAKEDSAADWQPVTEILRAAGRTVVPPSNPSVTYQPAGAPSSYQQPGAHAAGAGYTAPGAYAGPASYAAQGAYSPAAAQLPPPNLHWGLVLLFDVLTCSLFQMIWNIVMAAWFRRVSPPSKALWLYIASAILLIVQGISGQALGLMASRHTIYSSGTHPNIFAAYTAGGGLVYVFIALVCWVTRLVARFTFRSELESHFNTADPVGLRINPVLTFFFGGIYLQSVLNRINETKRLQAYGVLPR